MRILTTVRLFVAVVVATFLAACAGPNEVPAAPVEIEGDWRLSHGTVEGSSVPTVDGHEPTLTIAGDAWGGDVCNHYGATATRSAGRLDLDEVFQTEMACLDDRVMEAEAVYLDAFRRVASVEVVAGRLVLRGDDVELVYVEVEPEPDAPLVGTTWRLESLVHDEGPDGAVSQAMVPVELVFRDDGTVRAATGCRTLGGPYHLDGTLLDLTEVGGDGHGCEDAGLVEQDDHVVSVLSGGVGVSVSIRGQMLALSRPGGAGLHYRAR